MGLFRGITAKGFAVFLLVLYLGYWVGGQIVQMFPTGENQLLATALAMLVPAFIVYWAWVRYGRRHAD